uniref:Peptidase S1 domain-containing protein n=1 Tax=Megaselia scalaris TaxID=36166 RepID=T1GS04_MEGSC
MVYAGLYDKSNVTEGQQRFTDYTIVHESYPGKVGPNDIALMHVTEPFVFNDKVQPVLLPARKEVVEGDCHLYGWGQVKSLLPISPKFLQTMETDIILYEECKELLPPNAPISEVNVCSAPRDNKLSACNGDSGGPLVKETEDGLVQIVGVVSWGYIPCGNQGLPSIYTNVASYVDWIAIAKADYYKGIAFCAKL